MTLNLDLTACDAKLARARENLDTLQREAKASITKEATHAVRFSAVDPQTGWCSISLLPQKVEEPRLSAILGDVIHNLRCVLDYVVTALVDASATPLTTSHQFPIFKDAARYASKVGTKTQALDNGPLRHVTHGLALVEDWQPYHVKGDPRTDPLWGIHRFDNADKHHQPAVFGLVPLGSFNICFNGYKVEDDILEEVTNWKPGQEIPVGRIRFDPPEAENLRAEGNVSLNVVFITPPWLGDDDLTISLGAVHGIIEHVGQLVESFRLL
jgi:hypothetical protein